MKPATDNAPFSRGVLLRDAVERLETGGVEDARRNAEWMLTEVLQEGRALLYAYPERSVDCEARQAFEAMVRRRLAGEPLQYILGHTGFYGLRLAVTPAVLIPRPETEQVVEEALRRLRPVEAPKVLDAGTGSGCIALALKHERPEAAVYACDASTEALAVARANAEAHALDVQFTQADLLSARAAEHLPGALDLLISNPPYLPDGEQAALPPEVREHEPPAALFCGDDPLRFYRVLARLARQALVPGGWLVLEMHAPYAQDVRALLREAGLTGVETCCDLAGHPRIAVARRPGA